jgi:hypothetical protein
MSGRDYYPNLIRHTVFQGTNWTFHGDFADQGLLYFWTKYYYQKEVSIVHLDHVQQGSSDDADNLYLEATLLQKKNPFDSNLTYLPSGML